MSTFTIPIVAGGLLLILVTAVVLMRLRSSRRNVIEERLADFGTLERPPTLEEIELSQPFVDRVVVPLLQNLSRSITRLTPQHQREAIQHQLDLAGNPYDLAKFLGIRVLYAILLGGLGVAVMIFGKVGLVQRLLLPIGGALIGYVLPLVSLRGRIRRRQTSIVRSLPDALDLLTICVEAGLGFDAAMARVADKWSDELSIAFTRVLQELQLGKLRREALRDMADRMEVPEVSTFVAAIIQADQLGVSLARVLRIQSDQMRVRRRQRAEELARSAPIKMLPAIAFLIFPAIFVVLLGPAVLQIMNMEINLFGF
ncbi:MAG: type II secretion system F family protein [Chloroflexi bacterium]|nr:type II secretion system F family protein [Chloroflexota bacterium]